MEPVLKTEILDAYDSKLNADKRIGGNGDKSHRGKRNLPYVFTEQGIAMLSAVLRSDVAIQVSIRIMNTFVEMRHFLANK